MEQTITSALSACLCQFNRILDSDSLRSHASDVPLSLWQDELGRLRVWAANIGAHQKDQSSLDYRLRDASHIREQTIQLLRNLARWFDDLEDVLAHSPRREPGMGGEKEEEEEEEAEEDSTTDDGSQGDSEIQQIYKGLVETITCLYQMSMAIRRPVHHDRIIGTRKEDAVAYEFFDRQHVANKFPRAEASLVERLGAAISRRRAGFQYRQRHHEKLAHGLSNSSGESEHARTEMSATVATEFKGDALHVPDDRSDAGLSHTSYAPTLFNSTERLAIPIPERLTFGVPFECPYCYFIIKVRDHKGWARHVFQDLLPYMCPFDHCPTPNRLYSQQRAWYVHLELHHGDLLGTGNPIICPLCKTGTCHSQLRHHFSRHLEELALFAVPRLEDPEDRDLGNLEAPSAGLSRLLSGDELDSVDDPASDDAHDARLPSRDHPSSKAMLESLRGNLREQSRMSHEGNRLSTGPDASRWILPATDRDINTSGYVSSEHEEKGSNDIQPSTTTDSRLSGVQLPSSSSWSNLWSRLPTFAASNKTDESSAGKGPESLEIEPDKLLLNNRKIIYELQFPPYSLSAGSVSIGQIRHRAAEVLHCSEPRRVRLLYKGRLLEDDTLSCSSEGLKQMSEILCIISAIQHTGDMSEEEDGGDASQAQIRK
ncbi:hypothetical protein BJY04DRAFT_222563 [Aspergillus karnatakaensis]|uniref:uncharacterized protein n=1 Tax=Aspergillus karnatakaensis TaxID=1810916 RepID=UPI003CCCD283